MLLCRNLNILCDNNTIMKRRIYMIKIITNLEELKRSNECWECLKDFCNIFSFKEWVSTWWQCYGNEKELRLYMYLDEQNNVKAILPLMLKNEENNIVLLQMCDSCSDYYKVICSSKNLEELKCLLKNVLQNEKFDRFTISNLRETCK